MPKQRLTVPYEIEGTVEIEVDADATPTTIFNAAITAVRDEFRKSRGAIPGDIVIGDHEKAD